MALTTAPVRAAWSVIARNGPALMLALLPGAITVYFGFRAGGFFVGSTAGMAAILLVFLAIRVMWVPLPAEGLNRSVAIAAGAMALFALLVLVSSRWSNAPARALIEFDRALLYTLALVVFGTIAMDPRRLAWMVRGLALATVIICGAGLITRLLPELWPVVQSPDSTRLAFPVTYWNALGLVAAIGITLCLGLTSREREPRLVRVLAAAAIPILASALILTLSRGAVAVTILGVVVFALAGHPRALISGLIAAAPATVVAIASTYGAELLVSDNPLSAAARAQGEDLAAIVALCAVGAGLARALLLYADEMLARLRLSPARRSQLLGFAATGLALVAVAGAVAVDATGQYEAFVTSGASESTGDDAAGPKDPRSRLTRITDNGRIGLWTVAIGEFERNPVRGAGAGTFENSWDRHRNATEDVLDAHSLYAEVLGELGIVGLALLLVAIGTVLLGVARRVRGPDRTLFAAIFAALVAWVVAAGFDWHYEMPVVTFWVFALGGAAIAGGRRKTPPTRFLGIAPRAAMAIACCVVLVLVPVRLIISQDRLESTLIAYVAGRCKEATVRAGEARDIISSRPEPFEFIAGCALREGRAQDAVAAMRAAVRRDPESWRLRYSLGVAQARAGRDPRPAFRRAYRRNPQYEMLERTVERFARADRPVEWRATARRLHMQVMTPTV